MNLFFYFWVTVISVFLASFLSSIIIGAIFTGISFYFIIAIFNFLGIAIVGVPVSFIIQRLVKQINSLTIPLNILLHAIAGTLIVVLYFLLRGVEIYRIFNDEQNMYVYAGLINAVTYYISFIFLRKCATLYLNLK